MAPLTSLAVLGMLCSLPPTFGIKTKISADPTELDETSSSEDVESATGEVVEANCGHLYLPEGLQDGEFVKFSANGWSDEDRDLEVSLIVDHGQEVAKLKGQSAKDELPQLASEQGSEQSNEAVLGVRIGGISGSSDEESMNTSAVLVYGGDGELKEIPLETEAGPTTPFAVIIQRLSSSSVRVDVLAWQYGKGEDKSLAVSGEWLQTSKTVEVQNSLDSNLRLITDVNGCMPKFMKLYASGSGRVVTVKEGTCQSPEPQLVEVGMRAESVVENEQAGDTEVSR